MSKPRPTFSLVIASTADDPTDPDAIRKLRHTLKRFARGLRWKVIKCEPVKADTIAAPSMEAVE